MAENLTGPKSANVPGLTSDQRQGTSSGIELMNEFGGPTPIDEKGATGELRLVLVTPAHNEAAFLEQAIKSVVGQKVKPIKWIIVSDGSTDGTNEILQRYASEYGWIECILLPPRTERHFAGKVQHSTRGMRRQKSWILM